MKKSEVIRLYRALNQLGNLSGVKFTYAVARNIAALKSEIESLEKATVASLEYQEFDKLRVELVEKHAKKNDKGKPIIEGNTYVLEDEKAFNKAFDKLRDSHKKVVDAREKQIQDYNKLLDEEVTLDNLHRFKLADVPEGITAAQMNGIADLVDES